MNKSVWEKFQNIFFSVKSISGAMQKLTVFIKILLGHKVFINHYDFGLIFTYYYH